MVMWRKTETKACVFAKTDQGINVKNTTGKKSFHIFGKSTSILHIRSGFLRQGLTITTLMYLLLAGNNLPNYYPGAILNDT